MNWCRNKQMIKLGRPLWDFCQKAVQRHPLELLPKQDKHTHTEQAAQHCAAAASAPVLQPWPLTHFCFCRMGHVSSRCQHLPTWKQTYPSSCWMTACLQSVAKATAHMRFWFLVGHCHSKEPPVMAVLVRHSMWRGLAEDRTVLTFNSFISMLVQPKLLSSLNLPILLATTRDAKRENSVSNQPKMNGVEAAEWQYLFACTPFTT